MNNQKNALLSVESSQGNQSKIQSKGNGNFRLKPNTKRYNIVSLFCQGKKLSCLDHYWTGDTCLHSTVSGLSKRFNLAIPRTTTKLPNRQGKLVSGIAEYYFSDDDIAKMKPLLSGGK